MKCGDVNRATWSVRGLLFSAAISLAGCSFLPEPQSDPTRFYVLSPTNGGAAATASSGAPALHLRQIELASYMRARPMIVRKGENEVEFREYARWGEPLDQGIARVLREELLTRGAVSGLTISGVRAANRPADHELALRVLACEGAPDGTVKFRVGWDISATGDKPPAVARGDFRAADLRWDGKNEATLALALSKGVAALADEIAAALRPKS